MICIKNWLRQLFRRKRVTYLTKEKPIRRGNATAWPVVGQKKYTPSKAEIAVNKLWAKKKIDAMFSAEYITLLHPFDARDFGDRIYIDRISQLTEDQDKEQK